MSYVHFQQLAVALVICCPLHFCKIHSNDDYFAHFFYYNVGGEREMDYLGQSMTMRIISLKMKKRTSV